MAPPRNNERGAPTSAASLVNQTPATTPGTTDCSRSNEWARRPALLRLAELLSVDPPCLGRRQSIVRVRCTDPTCTARGGVFHHRMPVWPANDRITRRGKCGHRYAIDLSAAVAEVAA
jgi:hypothetical protein